MPTTTTKTMPASETTGAWSSWSTLPVGKDEYTEEQVFWDLKDAPHMLIAGRTGSGKTTAAARIAQHALEQGFDVRLVDAVKLAADFEAYFDLPKHTALDIESAHKLADRTYEELRRRTSLNREHKASAWCYLPPEIAPRPVLLVVEEAGALLACSTIEDREARKTNKLKVSMCDIFVKIAREGRPAGVHLLIITQRPDTPKVAGEFKNNLGARLLMGNSRPVEREMMGVGGIKPNRELLMGVGAGLFQAGGTETRQIQTP